MTMTRTISLLGGALVVCALAASAAAMAQGQQSSTSSRLVVAEYLRAVPAGPTAVRHCKRVCVKAGRGTDKVPAQCLQWKTVC
jgi:uncharacterized membrane-anchored protein